MVETSASGAEDPGFESRWRRDFSGSSHTSDIKNGAPVATLPGAWHYRVSAGTGWPGVSIVWLGEVESCICNFCLSVAAHKIVCADPSLRYTFMLLGHWATNQQTNHATFSVSVCLFVCIRTPKQQQQQNRVMQAKSQRRETEKGREREGGRQEMSGSQFWFPSYFVRFIICNHMAAISVLQTLEPTLTLFRQCWCF